MKIVIIDGQGGKLGKALVEKLVPELPNHTIICIGTNTMATVAMLKAGAPYAATGENPVIYNCKTADLIIGPIGIIKPNALFGEITPTMANAVGESRAHKILIPMSQCGITIVGSTALSLSELTDLAVKDVLTRCKTA